jgi:hypothetical protein
MALLECLIPMKIHRRMEVVCDEMCSVPVRLLVSAANRRITCNMWCPNTDFVETNQSWAR